MKKTLIILTAILIALPLLAMSDDNSSFIIANGKVYFGSKLKVGLLNTTIITTSGERISVPNNTVESYMTDKFRYDCLPVDNTENSLKVMLRLVKVRNGLSLYWNECPKIDNPKVCECYRVYKDGKLYLIPNHTTAPEIFKFFGIKVVE